MKNIANNRNLVFIIGVGRSGTSLLQSMLDSHPEIIFLPETHFFRRYVAPKRARVRFEKLSVDEFYRILRHDQELARAELPIDKLLSGFERVDATAIYTKLVDEYSRTYGAPMYTGDKDPRNIDYLPQLASAFPKAKVIHLIRDPRDVLASRLKAEWSATKPALLQAAVCAAQLKQGSEVGKRLFKNNYIELSYEHLIAKPETTLTDICKHLGLAFDPAMLDFNRSAERLVHESEKSWKEKNTGPLLSNNLNKWPSELSRRQIQAVELFSAEALEKHGYKRSTKENALIFRAKAGLARVVLGAYQLRTCLQ